MTLRNKLKYWLYRLAIRFRRRKKSKQLNYCAKPIVVYEYTEDEATAYDEAMILDRYDARQIASRRATPVSLDDKTLYAKQAPLRARSLIGRTEWIEEFKQKNEQLGIKL